jgi:hypothetical protein
VGAAVVSGVDAPPIFEPSEHVLDFVAPLVEESVIGDGDLPISFPTTLFFLTLQTVPVTSSRLARIRA